MADAEIKEENGVHHAEGVDPTANGTEEGVNAEMLEPQETEEDKYWKNVTENPLDFNSWTYLLQVTEKLGDLERLRKVYDGFLAHFPLCYVYWKKYADHEATLSLDQAIQVYERGVQAIAHSVDLWSYYATFVAERSEDLEQIRGLWERAAAAIGTDFASHTFWDRYLEFETSQEAYSKVTDLYQRILQIPLDHQQYFDKFRMHVTTRPLLEFITQEEVQQLEQEKHSHETRYKELQTKKEEGEAIDAAEMKEHGIRTGDEVEAEFRLKIMGKREDSYKKIAEEVTKRRAFETTVARRPYFHVKPMDEALLVNWRKYLDFEEIESAAKPEKIRKLYERCLIACCYYSEFWLRYAHWTERTFGAKEARAVFLRATTIFLPKRPDVHIEYAIFEEAHGDVAAARRIYENLATVLPGHAESTLRFASFERRHGHADASTKVFETALSIAASDAKAGPFMAIQFARFLERATRNTARAREVLESAIQKFPDNKNLWLAAVDLEASQTDALSVSRVSAAYVRAGGAESKLSQDDKLEMWHNALDFAADWTNDVQAYRTLQDQFRQAFPSGTKATENLKKRALLDTPTAEQVAKLQKTAGGYGAAAAPAAYSGAAAAAAYPYAQAYGSAYPATGAYAGYNAAAAYPYSQGYGATAATGNTAAAYAAYAAAGYNYAGYGGYTPTA